jgi:fructuronate reductase/mannitol 2-dehydrogenase
MTGGRGAVPLSDATLRALPASVAVPSYERGSLRPGIVHMSVGSFHRSHQAVYFDDLACMGQRDWGIVGLGLRRPRLRAALAPQDGLYTVVARGAQRDQARVIGAMTRYLFAPEDHEAALAALADERTAAVTLTVTAAAYDVDSPETSCALDYLVTALDRRRRAGRAPFTVLSCDNLPENGAVARAAVVAHAHRRDPRLAGWIDEHVAFPDSMVDRITPRSTLADRERLARDHGVLDRWPVVTEPFSQWIVEDRFCNRRPPLDDVGVQFVGDVKPYALMKTRLLNATHCAIGVLGSLAGLKRADEVMRDPMLRAYVERLMNHDVAPLLPRAPGIELPEYTRTLVERLSNPEIGDSLERLCRAGSSKVAAHVLPSIAAARAAGRDHRLLTLAVAGWLRYEHGSEPRPLPAACADLGDLSSDPRFVSELGEALGELDRLGVRATLAGELGERSVAA